MWAFVLTMMLIARPEMEARTLDDRAVQGTLVELTADHVALNTSNGEAQIQLADLLTLTPAGDASETMSSAEINVELVDGSSFFIVEYHVTGDVARLVLDGDQTVEIPTDIVSAVRFHRQSAEVLAQWEEIAAIGSAADVLVIRSGQSLDFLEGVLGDTVGTDTVQFTVGDQVLPVKRSKIEGLIYAHRAGRALNDPRCLLIDNTGARIPAEVIELVDDRLQVTSPAGLRISRPLESVVRLDFSRGKVQFLSDLTPESVRWTPYFGVADAALAQQDFFRFRSDRGLRDTTLRLGGKSYDRGLALHSRTELVYRLAGNWRSLRAVAGIDDSVQGKGHVRLTISGDDRVLWDETISGQDDPRELTLDVTGVRRLTILVDFGDDLDVADHLDLCDIRVIK